ncbi:hypothetical protein [Ensifer sp. LCM 4579]|uniref:hypothetical protein n=1 Tax=Ensifer sp. LCM 4579 TaxID=1848292 RepID=UPI0010422C10|nr:hypothetical protein [Ensifer sp. LCM 4579]
MNATERSRVCRRIGTPQNDPGTQQALEQLRQSYLIAIKRQRPRGHFGPWIREKSGSSEHVVHRYMRLAKDADQKDRSAAQEPPGAVRMPPQ